VAIFVRELLFKPFCLVVNNDLSKSMLTPDTALAVEMKTRPEVRRMVDSLLEACVAADCN
jgi:hypothetical protein